MSNQGPPPSNNSYNQATNSSVGNMRHGPPPPGGPPPPAGPMKMAGYPQPMHAPPRVNGPSSMPTPTNGRAAPPHYVAGMPPQRPYFSGPVQENSQSKVGQQMPGPGQFPPRTTNAHPMGAPHSGPPPRGPIPLNQINQNIGGPPPPSNTSQNLYQGGSNSQPLSRRPSGGPYGPSNQGLVGPPPPGMNSNQVGPSPGGHQRLSGPPPPGPVTTPTPGSLPGGRIPPPVGVHPPSSASHIGQGGGDFHAGSSGPSSERSSATSSPIPSQRYDALEGGTPFSALTGPPGTQRPNLRPSGPQQGYYGPPHVSSAAPYPGQQSNQFGAPPIRPTGPPTGMAGPPTGMAGPPTGMAGPPTGMAGPPTGMAGPPTGPPMSTGIYGKRQYPAQQPYYAAPPGQTPPSPGGMPSQPPLPNSSAGARQQGMVQNQRANNINAGMGNMHLQQGDVKAVNLLTERHILPPTKGAPPKAKISQDYQRLQVNPDVFRSTLTVIPQTQSLLQKSRLPLGLVIHPFRDLSHLPVIQSSIIVRCRSCRTYINPFVTIPDQRRWKCNLCHRTNDLPEEFNFDPVTKTYGEPQRRPEIKSATIEFIAPSEYMLRPPQPAVYLFLLDVSFGAVESGYLSVVCQTLLDTLDKMPGDARTLIGFLTFDSALHYYNLQEGASRPQMLICSDVEDVFLPCANDLLVNIQECKDLITELLTELPNMFLGNKSNQTALGPALQAALKLVGPTGGRVTVFQSTLPSCGVGALKAREDPNQRAASKNIANLGPATDFYKKMALDFSGQQVAVDTFIISSQYTDIATLAGVSKFSGGGVHYYPGFHTIQNPLQVERLEVDLRRYLSRKIGFEAVMRIRCTKGLSMHTFHGNFFVRSTDLLSLPNVSPDAGFAMQVSIEDPLHESTVACFQAALLYTSSKGERRIRVHTMCLPVTNQMSEIMAGADQVAIVGLLSRMAVDRSVTSSVTDARDALVNVCIDVLSAFKASLPEGQTVGALMAPTSLKLLPLYCLALLKNVAFRLGSSTRLDERVFAMEMYKCEPLFYIMLRVHPDLYALHTIADDEVILYKDNEVPQPPLIGLSSEYVNRDGVYLMDRGDIMYLFVCRDASPEFCSSVLDVPDFQSIPEGMIELPEKEEDLSDKVRSFIDWLLENRPFHTPLRVIRDDSKDRYLFIQNLIQDRAESSMSYYEFLQHLQKTVK